MIYEVLFSTSLFSFLTGLCFTVTLISALTALAFWSHLKDKALLYYALTILHVYPVVALASTNPLTNFNPDRSLNFIYNLSALLLILSYFGLVKSVFSLKFKWTLNRETLVYWLVAACALTRVAAFIFFSEPAHRVSSALVLIYLILCLFIIIRSKKRMNKLAKFGCIFFTITLLLYIFIRVGFRALVPFTPYIPLTFLVGVSVFSIAWLIGLIKLAYRAYRKAESASLRNMARAFIQLRDLMNTPLQTIELTVSLLEKKPTELSPLIQRIEKSLVQLRKVNLALATYEKDVDWEQTDNFLDINQIQTDK